MNNFTNKENLTDSDSKLIEITTKIWNQHYQNDKSKQLYPDENLVRLLSRYKQNPLIQNKKLTALDYGFGSGRHLALLDDFGFESIVGYDISEIAVDLANTQFKNNRKFHLQLLQPSVNLNYTDNSFDMIIIWGVLHYIPEAERARLLHDLQRLLSKQGQLLGTLRSTQDTQYATSDVSKAQIQFFTEIEAESLLKAYFNKVELGFMERSPIGQLHRRVSHWFFAASNEI